MLGQFLQNGVIDELAQPIEQVAGVESGISHRIVISVALLVLWFLISTLIKRIYSHRINETGRRYIMVKGVHYVLALVFIVILVRIWYKSEAGIFTYLGILSAGLAIALQLPITNLAGWLYIIWKRPFFVGDRIEMADFAGDVIDVGIFQFSLIEIGNWVNADQSTGRIVHVPNGQIFSQAVYNYTQGFNFIWNEISVYVTFESDWRLAKELLLQIGRKQSAIASEEAARQVKEAAEKFMLIFRHLTPAVWTSVESRGIILTLRYLCAPRTRRSTETKIWEDILTVFGEHRERVAFAYPTQRFFFSPGEWDVNPQTAGPLPSPQNGSRPEATSQQGPAAGGRKSKGTRASRRS